MRQPLQVHGIHGVRVHELEHGVLALQSTLSAPLDQVLRGINRTRWSSFSGAARLFGLSDTVMVPCTEPAVRLTCEELTDGVFAGELRDAAVRLLRLTVSNAATVKIARDFGVKLDNPAAGLVDQLESWEPAEAMRLFCAVAAANPPLGRFPSSTAPAHERILKALDVMCRFVVPAEEVRDELAKLTAVDAPNARTEGGQLHLALLEDPDADRDLDLLWPDLSRRVQIACRDGRWLGLTLRSPQQTLVELAELDPARTSVIELDGYGHALTWLAGLAGTYPWSSDQRLRDAVELEAHITGGDYQGQLLSTEAFPDVEPIHFVSAAATDVDRLLTQFAPVPDGLVMPTDLPFYDTFNYELEYGNLADLRARIRQTGSKAPRRSDETELRHAIAEHAVGRWPASHLSDSPCFVRVAADPGDRRPAQQLDLAALESLHCHALGGRFVFSPLPAQPGRLRGHLRPLETFTPLNPFADAGNLDTVRS